MGEGHVRPPPKALTGDWALIARFVGEGEAGLRELRQGLEWSSKKAGGTVHAMCVADLARLQKGRFWLTQRGLAAWRATR